MVRKRLYLVCFVLVMLFVFTGAAQAVVVNGDFEGAWVAPEGWMGVTVPPFTVGTIPNGWGTWTGGANLEDIYAIAGNPGGATPTGGAALEVLPGNPTGGFSFLWTLQKPVVPINTCVTMYVDIIDLTPGGAQGNYAGVSIGGSEVKFTPGNTYAGTAGGGVTNQWKTFSYSWFTGAATVAELKVVVSTNMPWINPPGDTPAVYGFDNVVLVPEPATMVLLGLGSLALLKRRKS